MKKSEIKKILSNQPASNIIFSDFESSVRNKICLVTGGGGSIGSQLCRFIAECAPKKLIITDIYENGAYDLQQELKMNYGGRLPIVIEIASVRDRLKTDVIFARHKPQLVFHTAAHKHVPLMENAPEEAVKNNVRGTYDTAESAAKHGAEKFLLVSTDKAVNPTSVMGATKLCCEMIMKRFSEKYQGTAFITLRCANVIGSSGSVIPLFEKQLKNGGPITVTHPEITRYFISVAEAAAFALRAAAEAKTGQVCIPCTDSPVNISQLAHEMARKYNTRAQKENQHPVEIEYTGLRPGEKLHEELFNKAENPALSDDKKVFYAELCGVADDFEEKLFSLFEAAEQNDGKQIIQIIKKICPSFSAGR